MSFRSIDLECMSRGVILAICHQFFSEGVPSLGDFAVENGVAPSTFRRAADWLLELLPAIWSTRKPGPTPEITRPESGREEAVKRLTDLYRWLEGKRSRTEKNACYCPEAKQRIAAITEAIHGAGSLSFAEMAEVLEMNERQLRRIREEVQDFGGEPPAPKSRKPRRTQDLAPEIQVLIQAIQASGNSRDPYTAADVKRILEKNYKDRLGKYHDSETIAEDTVRKYMERKLDLEKKEHPRGSYVYPEAFQQVAIDTSYFKVFGYTFYLITVLEIGARLNLVTRVFLRENTQAVVSTLEEYLETFGGIGVVVIDRGSPYLNETVKNLLEENGKVRLVCPRATPTAKAACEKHFDTLKSILRAALSRILPEDPGWPREWLAKSIEMGIAVFQKLYHRIPQEGNDGKSPAERADEMNSVRAWSQMVELFERAMRSEPAEEIAGEIHDRFQLPGPKKKTTDRLRPFGGRVLRQVLETLRGKIGPPHPGWLYDPLGYIAVRAKEISEAEHLQFFRKQRQKEEGKQRDAERREHQVSLEEKKEHPERFVDDTLEQAIRFVDLGIPGAVRIRLRDLKSLLDSLSEKMGRAFKSEIARLHTRIDQLTENAATRRQVHEWLEARASPVAVN